MGLVQLPLFVRQVQTWHFFTTMRVASRRRRSTLSEKLAYFAFKTQVAHSLLLVAAHGMVVAILSGALVSGFGPVRTPFTYAVDFPVIPGQEGVTIQMQRLDVDRVTSEECTVPSGFLITELVIFGLVLLATLIAIYHSRIDVFYEYDTSAETLMALCSIGGVLGVTLTLTESLFTESLSGDSSQSAAQVSSVVTVMTCVLTSAAVFILAYGHATWAWVGSLRLVRGKGTFTAYKQAVGCVVQTQAKSKAAERQSRESANSNSCAARPSISGESSLSGESTEWCPISPTVDHYALSSEEHEPSATPVGGRESTSASPSAARAMASPDARGLAPQTSRQTSGVATSISRPSHADHAPQDAGADETDELDDSELLFRLIEHLSGIPPPSAPTRSKRPRCVINSVGREYLKQVSAAGALPVAAPIPQPKRPERTSYVACCTDASMSSQAATLPRSTQQAWLERELQL